MTVIEIRLSNPEFTVELDRGRNDYLSYGTIAALMAWSWPGLTTGIQRVVMMQPFILVVQEFDT